MPNAAPVALRGTIGYDSLFLLVLYADIQVNDLRNFDLFLFKVAEKFCCSFVAHLLHDLCHDGFVKNNFSVLESSLQQLFRKLGRTVVLFVQCLAYFVSCFGGSDKIKPLLFGLLGIGGLDFNSVSVCQLVIDFLVTAIDFSSDAGASEFRMDFKSKVQIKTSRNVYANAGPVTPVPPKIVPKFCIPTQSNRRDGGICT